MVLASDEEVEVRRPLIAVILLRLWDSWRATEEES